MVDLARQAQTPELKEAREQTSRKLLELAQDCKEADQSGRRAGSASRESSTGASSGSSSKSAGNDWLVKKSLRCGLTMLRGWMR